ncbi:LPS translocon maturation chaperone LptM [Acidovorax lacteus]|uniref:Lipoprotein n=1 Tax=Acidovorax lacteus TaxID=1924988 RepID=A0ABP8L5U7_9BURK
MSKAARILVTAGILVAGGASLGGCGQRGPLYLPQGPEAAQRATLPQTLDPIRNAPAPATPAVPASAPR